MKKENIKQEEKREIAMVECPFCNKAIEAPAKADVIFTCPHCHKELITYDKSTEQVHQTIQNRKRVFSQKQLSIGGSFIILIIILLYFISNNDSTKRIKEIQKYRSQTIANTAKKTVPSNFAEEQKKEWENEEKENEEKEQEFKFQEITTWRGSTYYGDECAYTLLKYPNGRLALRENKTNNIFDCTKHIIQNRTEYYFVDPDIADINVNLACFNLKKGATIYIIHKFDYDSTEQKYMDGILVLFNDNNVRIYLDLLTNGTAYYCNNGNPPISRLNKNGHLEYYNSDGSNEPAYECYAKLYQQ